MATENASEATAHKSELMPMHFVLRRLHSLSGVVPVGVFVIFHLFTNMQLSFKPIFGWSDEFQHEVEWIHSAIPALWAAEIFGIWLPIAFHAVLGIAYTFTGKGNVKSYGYYDNWRYVLQRVTGIVALLFIFFHIATLRWRWDIGGWFTPFFVDGIAVEPASGTIGMMGAETLGLIPLASYSTAVALENPLVLLLYIVGVLSVVYHWSNGLWTAAISWGVTLTARAQRNFAYVCYGLFAFLFACSALAIAGALAYQPTDDEVLAYEVAKQLYAEEGLLPHEVFAEGHDGGTIKPEHREIVTMIFEEKLEALEHGSDADKRVMSTQPATPTAATISH